MRGEAKPPFPNRERNGRRAVAHRTADLLTSHSHKIRSSPYPPVRGKADAAACPRSGQICLRYMGNTLVQRLLSRRCTWRTDGGWIGRGSLSLLLYGLANRKLVHNRVSSPSAAHPSVPRGTIPSPAACRGTRRKSDARRRAVPASG